MFMMGYHGLAFGEVIAGHDISNVDCEKYPFWSDDHGNRRVSIYI